MTVGPIELCHPRPWPFTLETLSFGCRADYRKYSILSFKYVVKSPLRILQQTQRTVHCLLCNSEKNVFRSFLMVLDNTKYCLSHTKHQTSLKTFLDTHRDLCTKIKFYCPLSCPATSWSTLRGLKSHVALICVYWKLFSSQEKWNMNCAADAGPFSYNYHVHRNIVYVV